MPRATEPMMTDVDEPLPVREAAKPSSPLPVALDPTEG